MRTGLGADKPMAEGPRRGVPANRPFSGGFHGDSLEDRLRWKDRKGRLTSIGALNMIRQSQAGVRNGAGTTACVLNGGRSPRPAWRPGWLAGLGRLGGLAGGLGALAGGPAALGQFTFTGAGTPNNTWCTPGNWQPMQVPPAGSPIMIGPGEPIDMFTCGEGPYAVGPISTERRVRFWPKMDFLAGGMLFDADLAMNAGNPSVVTGTLTLSGTGTTFTSGLVAGGTLLNTGTMRTVRLGFTGHGTRTVGPGAVLQNQGRLEVQAPLQMAGGGMVRNNGELEFLAGEAGGATVSAGVGGVLINSGTIGVGSGVAAVIAGGYEGPGAINVNSGTLEFTNGLRRIEDAALTLSMNGTILVSGGVALDEMTMGNTTVSGEGTLKLDGSNVALGPLTSNLSRERGNGLWFSNRSFDTYPANVQSQGLVSWSQGTLQGLEPVDQGSLPNLTLEPGALWQIGFPVESPSVGQFVNLKARVTSGAEVRQQGEFVMPGSFVQVEEGANWTVSAGRGIRGNDNESGFLVKGDLLFLSGPPAATIARVDMRVEGNGRLLLGNTRLEVNNLILTGVPLSLAENAIVDISTLGELRLQCTMAATRGSPRWVGSGKLATTGNGPTATFVRIDDGATLTNELSGSTAEDGFFLNHTLTSGLDDEDLIGFVAQFINAGDMYWRAGQISVSCDSDFGDGFTNLARLYIQNPVAKVVASCTLANRATVLHEAGRVELSSLGTIRNEAAYIISEGLIVNTFPTGRFVNSATGTFSKVTPGTTAEIFAPLDNQGTLAVVEGTLGIFDPIAQVSGSLNNGSLNGGRWTVNAGATLSTVVIIRTLGAGATVRLDGAWPEFQPSVNQGSLTLTGPRTFTGGITNSGGGTIGVNGPTTFGGPVRVEGGVVAINQALTAPTFTQTGGLVIQTGALRLSGPLTLSGGSFDVDGMVEWGGLSASVHAAAATIRGVGQLGGVSSPPVTLECSGCTISPGNSPGVLTVDGSVAFDAGAVLEVEFAGLEGAGDPVAGHDLLTVMGPATLGGTLRLALLGSFVPSAGDAFTVLTAGEISGAFAAIEAPVVHDGAVRARVGVEPAPGGEAVVVRFLLAEDFNGDGLVNPDDLSDYITTYFDVPPGPAADFNLDGVVDPDDLSDFITAYFN